MICSTGLGLIHSNEDALQVLSPEATSDLKKRVQTCEFEYPKEEFEVLAPDGFVDIKAGVFS